MIETCAFETERLVVAPWHEAALPARRTLPHVIAGMLTPRTTAALPEHWHGDYSEPRAREWIAEQDLEGANLLVSSNWDGSPIGLLFLGQADGPAGGIEVRLGYLIDELSWRRGFASELVEGLIEWAEATPGIDALAGGVSRQNIASAQVLIKNGFVAVPTSEDALEQIFRLRV